MGRDSAAKGRFVVPVLGTAIVALLASAGLAVANIPSSTGVINGCRNTSSGALRVIDAEAGQVCGVGEVALNWNQTGPRGATGPAGPPGPGAETPAGQKAFLSCTGITGGVVQKGLEGSMEVASAHHELVSPRDPATGQASGKRQHRPLTIVKTVDRATPQLYKALINNQVLPTCTLKFFVLVGGVPKNLYTIKLTNASVASVELTKGDVRFQQGRLGEFEEVTFTYQKIEWTFLNGTTAITQLDNWSDPVG